MGPWQDKAKPLAAALAACLALVAAGCGDEEPDLSNGKELFVQKCSSCHNLKRANSEGKTQGPDLDAAFAAARRDGLGESAFEGVVHDQIANPLGGQMPADLVKGDDARDVAAYVAYATAKPGEDQGALAQAGRPSAREAPVVASGGTLELEADPTGFTAFTVPGKPNEGAVMKAEAKPGGLRLVMPNPSSIPHNIALRGGKIQPVVGPVVNQGGTSEAQVPNVGPGEYVFYCSVPGHEQGGMKGTLTVK